MTCEDLCWYSTFTIDTVLYNVYYECYTYYEYRHFHILSYKAPLSVLN